MLISYAFYISEGFEKLSLLRVSKKGDVKSYQLVHCEGMGVFRSCEEVGCRSECALGAISVAFIPHRHMAQPNLSNPTYS